MSLSKFNKIDEKIGAIFNSHIDGKKIILSPEKSIKIQKSINSDILMVLDECPKLTNDKKIIYQKQSILQLIGQKDVKLNLVIIKKKAFWYCTRWII